MGQPTSAPVEDKKTVSGKAADFFWVSSEMQGYRGNMEDAHVFHPAPTNDSVFFFGLYDGHGSAVMAKLCEHQMPHFIFGMGESHEPLTEEQIASGCHFPVNHWGEHREIDYEDLEKVKERIEDGIFELDEHCAKIERSLQTHGGSTATNVLIMEKHFILINLGDSRTVLYRQGSEIIATEDHKPDKEVEKERIVKAGGHVENGRVCGDLAVSRAIGDFYFKKNEKLKPREQMVVCTPEFYDIIRNPDVDEFIILACDGLWDVMTNEEAGQAVRYYLTKYKTDYNKIAECMLHDALHFGSSDNISITIIFFPAAMGYTDGTKTVDYEWPPEGKVKELRHITARRQQEERQKQREADNARKAQLEKERMEEYRKKNELLVLEDEIDLQNRVEKEWATKAEKAKGESAAAAAAIAAAEAEAERLKSEPLMDEEREIELLKYYEKINEEKKNKEAADAKAEEAQRAAEKAKVDGVAVKAEAEEKIAIVKARQAKEAEEKAKAKAAEEANAKAAEETRAAEDTKTAEAASAAAVTGETSVVAEESGAVPTGEAAMTLDECGNDGENTNESTEVAMANDDHSTGCADSAPSPTGEENKMEVE